ncbi:Pimeloyl-ACP methyl ester carboxylesterase [Amycolatopsis xylanica]|uniref:Pimeloyl-ACP methyl ester carboxylesterase n=1 Tax=Amycolatopsis xylanica TaxID=589385 RepID=A0A1H3RYR8_9PSEU|nr:alpha/beta hydrolase [Amycolatopsis xylanica]SDZ30411.1 Pimeloyl-ACP methyl ester carboxylesterase [Amycolatopsis xylanica]
MPAFTAFDGTNLAFTVFGDGDPLVCLPGGPMQDADYLGDLGGLSERFQLILLDPRGTGESAIPSSLTSYRCDRQVDDVEALREHLGLDRLNLFAHSAGANLAVLYAARYPERVAKLVLATPSTHALGIMVTPGDRRAAVGLRSGEPWFGAASEAFERVNAGGATNSDWDALAPFTYARWDATTQAHHARGETHRNERAAILFGAKGAFNPEATREMLAAFDAPVLVLAGEFDVNSPPRVVAELADAFPNSTLVLQTGVAHCPWLDDPAGFGRTVTGFLESR